jgi:hypothetical protein
MRKNINFQGVFGYDKNKKVVLVKVGGKLYKRKLLKDPVGFFVQVNNRLYGIENTAMIFGRKEK